MSETYQKTMINIFPLWETLYVPLQNTMILNIYFLLFRYIADAIASVENAIRLSEKERIDTK